MPVRNGYEVCEYVKKDSRFAHVPVVLLVGAFDPLDEREAQRVGADGILKKPFVPPDPLITMVKTLLDRTLGERLVAVAGLQTASRRRSKRRRQRDCRSAFSRAGNIRGILEPRIPAPGSSVWRLAEGERPVAFGQLLETPAQDSATPEHSGRLNQSTTNRSLTSSRDATLGEPIFWRNDFPEAEREAEEPEDISISPEVHTWKQGRGLPAQP